MKPEVQESHFPEKVQLRAPTRIPQAADTLPGTHIAALRSQEGGEAEGPFGRA